MANLKPKTWVYTLPNQKNEGWARAFLTEDGMFTCMSDYGDYAYWWTSTGDDNFRRWFSNTIKRDPHYLLDKFGYGKEKVYNGQKTLAHLTQHLEETMEKDEQRLILDEIEEHFSNLYDQDDFRRWIENGEHAIFDLHEFAVYEPCGQLRGFVDRILPRLREAIEEELKNEQEAQRTDAP
jgi:hypothetical protein